MTRSNVFGLQHYLAEACKVVFQFEAFFGARMGISPGSLPAQTVARNPKQTRPTRLKLICPRPIAGLFEAVIVVTTAPRGRILTLGISCAAVFSITRHFSRRMSSPIFPRSDGGVPVHCDAYRAVVRSLSLLETGERSPAPPPDTIVISSSIFGNPFNSPKYRLI